MISDRVHAMHLAELGFLQSALEDEGFTTQLLEKTPEIPLHVLLLSLGKDSKDRDKLINFNFVPLPDDEIEAIRLLQMYSVVPCPNEIVHREAVEKLLHAVNGVLPLGNYGIKEDGEIYFRYVYCASASRTLSEEEMVEVIAIFTYVLDVFAGKIEDVASGAVSLQEALNGIG